MGRVVFSIAAAVLAVVFMYLQIDDTKRIICSTERHKSIEHNLKLLLDTEFVQNDWQTNIRLWDSLSPTTTEDQKNIPGLREVALAASRIGTAAFPRRVRRDQRWGRTSSPARGAGDGSDHPFTDVISNMQLFVPAAHDLAELLAIRLGVPFLVNQYLSPQAGEPICAHSDPQEVFILQLQGCRAWTIWGDVPAGFRPHPLRGDTMNCQHDVRILDRVPRRRVQMHPGSLLYIPRGLPHQTGPCGTKPSLHWTLTGGSADTSAYELIFRALHQLMREDGARISWAAFGALEGLRRDEGAIGDFMRQGVSPELLLSLGTGNKDNATDLESVLDNVITNATDAFKSCNIDVDGSTLKAVMRRVLQNAFYLNEVHRRKMRAQAIEVCDAVMAGVQEQQQDEPRTQHDLLNCRIAGPYACSLGRAPAEAT